MFGTVQRNRLLLTLGIVLCFCLFWWLGAAVGFPYHDDGSASLLQQPGWVLALLTAWVGIAIAVLIGTAVAGTVHVEAGLYCATLGLSALSMRGGPMRYTLFNASGRSVYLLLALELILLFAVIAGVWLVLMKLRREKWLTEENLDQPDDEPLDQKLLATAAHALTMIVGMTILSRSDAKAQVLAAVGISSFLGTLGATALVPARPSAWYWAGPLVVGLIGYVFSFVRPAGIEIGQAYNYLGALARPLPLDYASFGVAGALLGYWSTRSWREPKLESSGAAV